MRGKGFRWFVIPALLSFTPMAAATEDGLPPAPAHPAVVADAVLRLAQANRPDLSGSWSIIDPRTSTAISTAMMQADSRFSGGPFKGSFVGYNGLGANQWRLADGVLSFIYVAPGRPRVDEMLTGYVESVTPTEFKFTVGGGYYGRGASTNMVLLFKRN